MAFRPSTYWLKKWSDTQRIHNTNIFACDVTKSFPRRPMAIYSKQYCKEKRNLATSRIVWESKLFDTQNPLATFIVTSD